ncbi:ribonuclease H-like domain-containing protein [Tanacetum coccineum]
MDEEVAKQIHLDEMVAKRMAEEEALSKQQKKRKAQVQFEAQYYTEEDWDAIRAKLEANAELTKDLLGKDLPEQILCKNNGKVAEVKEEEPVKRTGKRKKQKARKGISVNKNAQGDSETDIEESVEAMNPTPLATKSNIVLYRLVMQKYGTNRPEDAYNIVLWSDLRTMFDPPSSMNDCYLEAYTLQQKWLSIYLVTKNEALTSSICKRPHGKEQSIHLVVYNEELAIPEQTATGKGISNPLMAGSLPKTTKPTNQERVKSILLLAILDEYLLKFHNVADAKSLWEAIKSRFGGNIESKKMQKNVLKHQFENFSTASNESLDKAYDRSLPSSWNQITLIMRNKPDIDGIDIDDLYNNLRVYEDALKSTASGDFGVSTAGGINQVPSTLCAHDMDGDDLEELDLRWQVAMLTVRVKKFIQRTGRNLDFKEKRPVSLDKSKIECYNCHKKGHFARECRSERNQGRRSYGDNGRSNAPTNESSSQALVAQDGLGGYDWSNDFEVEPVNYALMNYDTEREKHNKAKLEISGYEIALESLESTILGHEKNELAWEKVVKERDELKDKIAKWEESSKNLDEILNKSTLANDRSSKADRYKSIPPPITGNFLTPRANISFAGLDEYAIRNKIIESQTTELNTKTSETAG